MIRAFARLTDRLIPESLIALVTRLGVAAIFFQSGRTKVDGLLHITDGTYSLFREEYRLPLIPSDIAAHLATYSEHLFAILLAGRAQRRAAQAASAQPATLAERLQPMVEAAAAGQLDSAGKAQLERLLLAFWRRRLELEGVKAADAMPKLRNHGEAGALLRQLEDWLHRPKPTQDVDLGALLAPYRSVAAATVEADAAREPFGGGH